MSAEEKKIDELENKIKNVIPHVIWPQFGNMFFKMILAEMQPLNRSQDKVRLETKNFGYTKNQKVAYIEYELCSCLAPRFLQIMNFLKSKKIKPKYEIDEIKLNYNETTEDSGEKILRLRFMTKNGDRGIFFNPSYDSISIYVPNHPEEVKFVNELAKYLEQFDRGYKPKSIEELTSKPVDEAQKSLTLWMYK